MKEEDVLPVCVDFDGVMKEYLKGWNYGDPLGNSPLPGAIESVKKLMENHPVILLTAREPEQVEKWISKYGFECCTDWDDSLAWKKYGTILITNHKHNALAYIDDRAIHFKDWPSAMKEMESRGFIPKG